MSTVLILTFVCCIGAQTVKQPKLFQTSKLGDNVIIKCYLPNKDFNNMVWYKQDIGNKLQAIVKSYIYLTNVDFVDEYDNGRFNVTIDKGIYHLHILATKKQDMGTYFCGVISTGELSFGPGTLLMLQDEHSTTILQEMISEVHTGDNVTFTCRVQMEDRKKCEAGLQAFWFREAEDESRSGIIYTDGGMNKQEDCCEDDSDIQSCIYTLTKWSLDFSDAGVYYCAVIGYDKIMFGNGTRLEFSSDLTSPMFLLLITSNIISIIIMIFLMKVQCKNQVSSSASVYRCRDQTSIEDPQVGYADVIFSSNSRPSGGADQNGISQHNNVYSQIRS